MKINDIFENTTATDTSHHKLITNPERAYYYAKDVIKGRWPEAEKYIVENPKCAYLYALNVIKGRWSEAEKYIMRSHDYALLYTEEVINMGKSENEPNVRWKEAEPIIMADPWCAYLYALNVIKGRWPEAENIIMTDPDEVYYGYYKDIIIPSVLNSNPNSKQIFRLLMDITKYCNTYKSVYDDFIKLVFPDSSIMTDKWINYGNNQRGKK